VHCQIDLIRSEIKSGLVRIWMIDRHWIRPFDQDLLRDENFEEKSGSANRQEHKFVLKEKFRFFIFWNLQSEKRKVVRIDKEVLTSDFRATRSSKLGKDIKLIK